MLFQPICGSPPVIFCRRPSWQRIRSFAKLHVPVPIARCFDAQGTSSMDQPSMSFKIGLSRLTHV